MMKQHADGSMFLLSAAFTIKKVDGHDREDEIAYRNDFLERMEELDRKSNTCEGTIPHLEVGEKPYIRVVHDESTYFVNSNQSYFWGDEDTNVLRQKASIIVSNFVDEASVFVRNGDNMARLLLETQKEGYFTSDHLLKQAVDIFEEVHPEALGIFLFDNAPSHRKVTDDALNADKMNVGPGGKQPKMRDTVFDGQI